MSFATQISQDISRVEFRDWGESITYTPSGGEAETITAIVFRNEEEITRSDSGLEIIRRMRVRLMSSDVASPARGDVAEFPVQAGGTAVNWDMTADPLVSGDGTAIVVFVRREVIERSAAGHRAEL